MAAELGLSRVRRRYVTTSYRPTRHQAEAALLDCGVAANRSPVPGYASGPGTPRVYALAPRRTTTLALGANELEEVADILSSALRPTVLGASPEEVSRAHYTVDERTATTCLGRCADLRPVSHWTGWSSGKPVWRLD